MAKAQITKAVKGVAQRAFDKVAGIVLKETREQYQPGRGLFGRNPSWLGWTRVCCDSDQASNLLSLATRDLASGAFDVPATLTNVFTQGIELGWELAQRSEVGKFGIAITPATKITLDPQRAKQFDQAHGIKS